MKLIIKKKSILVANFDPIAGIGQNDYSKSSLNKILNNHYYNSLKYTGNKTYDFTSTGIKNDITRNMIAETNYSLLGWNDANIYSNQMYNYERTTGSVYTGHATSWTGKIALAYPSDYGYAVDLGKCTGNLYNYNNSTCTANNWMKSILGTSSYDWLLTPGSGNSSSAWGVSSSGNVGYGINACYAGGVAPVLFLNSNASVKAGTGTSSDPYQISV